jgi:hypothetical protein
MCGLAALNLWSELNKIASAQVKAKREDLTHHRDTLANLLEPRLVELASDQVKRAVGPRD